MSNDKILGSLLGLAYGDAMGRPTEFVDFRTLVQVFGEDGPVKLPLGDYTVPRAYGAAFGDDDLSDLDAWFASKYPDYASDTNPYLASHAPKVAKRKTKATAYKVGGGARHGEVPARVYRKPVDPKIARVTDDTHMALYVGAALATAAETGYLTPLKVTARLQEALVDWYKSPEQTGDRAPGGTCLSACSGMSRGQMWWQATGLDKKGCGANMRVTPVGLCDWLDAEQRSGIAQLQAAMTHWHPTALAASDVTQYAVWVLRHGVAAEDLLDALLAYVADRRPVDPREWLGDILGTDGKPVGHDEAVNWLKLGWDETATQLRKVRTAWVRGKVDRYGDPCAIGGAGWTAEQALATAVHCFLLHPDSGLKAVARAAMTSGDSDSIAAIAGAFAGASLGVAGFPAEWRKQIEFDAELTVLADRLS